MKARVMAAVLVLLGGTSVRAAEPYRVKDINQTPTPANSSPTDLLQFGGLVLFSASNDTDGRELWRSDGTAAGTYELVDACPDACDGGPRVVAVTSVGAFFVARTTVDTADLWVTRGTTRDTFDLGPVGSVGESLWVASRKLLFFSAFDGSSTHLFRSDGTRSGTYVIGQVAPIAGIPAMPGLVELAGHAYFSGQDGVHGYCLWRSDGTAGGTVLLWDPKPETTDFVGPQFVGVLDGRLFFVAPGPDGPNSLWAVDRSWRPPVLVAALPGDLYLLGSTPLAGRLLIATNSDAADQLWATDGSTAGTRRLSTTLSRFAYAGFGPSATAAGKLLFGAADATHGSEPWISDGTPAGTHPLADLCPGACSSRPSFFRPVGGGPAGSYFTADDGVHGNELWRTDGSTSGTRLVRDLCTGSCSGDPFGLQASGDKLVFIGREDGFDPTIWRTDGTTRGTVRVVEFGPGNLVLSFGFRTPGGVLFVRSEPVHGQELWKTNGTARGTTLVEDIASADLGGSGPSDFMRTANTTYFFADDGVHGSELWKTNATEAGTQLVAELTPGPEPRIAPMIGSWVAAGSELFFHYNVSLGPGLWRSDGTRAGTFRIADGALQPGGLAALGGAAYFVAAGELWQSDGTVAGTRRLTDRASGVRELTAFRHRLFFAAGAGEGDELWATDGTAAGTIQVKDIRTEPGMGSAPDHLAVHGDFLYFFADDGEHGQELWRSDGTSAGTTLVADLVEGPGSFQPVMVKSTGAHFFVVGDDGDGPGIWATDGTAAGTRKLATLPTFVSSGVSPAVFQSRLYFALDGGASGPDLWESDGTAAGTSAVVDRDGRAVRALRSLTTLGPHLYFTRGDVDRDLWQTDGTRAGTRPVPDPPSGPLRVGSVFAAGTRLLFAGDEPLKGTELWGLDPN